MHIDRRTFNVEKFAPAAFYGGRSVMNPKLFSSPMDLTRVAVTDPFWKRTMELVRKEVIGEEGYFALDGNTIINPEDKTITSFLWSSVSECGIYGYQVHDNGDIYSAYHIHNYVNPSNDFLISDTTYFVVQ